MKFGLIGLGFGRHYLRILQEKGHTVITATTEPNHLFANHDIKAIIIASPPHTHFEYIRKALARGKDVLVEKPMTTNVKDALAIRSLIGSRIFMVGHQYLYNDSVALLVRKIEEGAIGELREIHMEHYFSKVREDIDVFWDAAPHELAVLDLFHLGELVNIYGIMGRESASIDMRFKTLRVKLDYSSNSSKLHKWTFTGEMGTLEFVDNPKREPLQVEVEHFIECIRTRSSPLTDYEHGLRVIKNLERIDSTFV